MTEVGWFTCQMCKHSFESQRTIGEAYDELLDNFTPQHFAETQSEGIGVVCDDCYDYVMNRIRAENPEILRPEVR